MHPERGVRIVTEWVVGKPLSEVGGAADNHGAASAGFPIHIQGIAVVILCNVFELEVSLLSDATPGFPEHANERLVTRVHDHVEQRLDVLWREQIVALQLAFIALFDMCGDPGDHAGRILGGESRLVPGPKS